MENVRDLIITAAVAFVAGALGIFLLSATVASIRRRGSERRQTGAAEPKGKRWRWASVRKPKTSTVVLVFVAAFILLFTNRMIELYEATGGIPDTLVVSVFGICGGECGALSWIRTSKEKHRDRRWSLEDEKRMNKADQRTAHVDSMEPSFTVEQQNSQGKG